MVDSLTPEELSRRTGEPPERLEKWRAAGLIGLPEGQGFDHRDVGRARLVHDVLHYGISLESLARAIRQPDSVLRRILDEVGERVSGPMYTLAEAAEIVGLDLDLARRLVEAGGLHQPGEMVDHEDIPYFRSCKIALDAGYPEEALLQILRVYADAMSRVAEVGSRTSHFYIHQRLKGEGLTPQELVARLEEAGMKIEPLVEPALLFFHRKGVIKATWDDMLMHLEEEAGLAERTDTPGQIRQAVMFVDLASFTPLAEAMGDVKAAEVLQRFSEMVRAAARRCHGRIVKQIGDAFMIVFSECFSAVSCALELEERAGAEPQFPAVRAGLHWGPVLYREGDYLGSNVNIASRLGSEAQRHQTLVTGDVRRRAQGMEGVEFIRLGKRRLKGLAAEVEIFEARAAGPELQTKVIDPVCGMELGPGEVAARLSLDGRDQAFCSEDCLRKFVRAPEKYAK